MPLLYLLNLPTNSLHLELDLILTTELRPLVVDLLAAAAGDLLVVRIRPIVKRPVTANLHSRVVQQTRHDPAEPHSEGSLLHR